MSGVVVVEIRIEETGAVSVLRVLKGHPLLDAAAVESVKQWKYEPVVLDGQLTAIVTTVLVDFE